MTDYSMPEFRDEHGRVMVWDPTSMSYVVDPNGNGLPDPDRGHASGGDNDLFDPVNQTERAGVPELEGYMAKTAHEEIEEWGEQTGVSKFQDGEHVVFRGGQGEGEVIQVEWWEGGWWYRVRKSDGQIVFAPEEACVLSDEPGDMTIGDLGIPPEGEDYYRTAAEWAPKGHVLCPNCREVTDDRSCPTCGKDLTPEWHHEHENNEFMDTMPQWSNASEFTSWPIREPKRNRMHTDDSFPSETTARTYEAAVKLASFHITADEWDDLFSGAAPLKTEIGKWLIDRGGSMHIDHGMHALHESIAQRDGLNYPGDVGALGSVYNDGTADTQRVFPDFRFDQQAAQAQIEQAFGPVTLQAPVAQAGAAQKGPAFEPFVIQGGQWVVAPQHAMQPLSGIAWVKERPEGQSYQPNMILVAEHLQPEDFELWSRGVTAIITATGGLTSHAAYLASTEGIPVVVGIGSDYNKVETGNYLKVDPATQTITVMPGASSAMSPTDKQNVWDSYLQYQRQRGGSLKPEYFAHIDEELAWREANTPTLDSCPECSQPMTDQDGESVCHGCGHKQPIIQHQAGALALIPEIAGGAEGAGAMGAAEGAGGAGGLMGGGGISGIGGLMTKALGGNPLQTAYYGDRLMGGGNDQGGGGGDAGTAGLSQNFDSGAETQGIISSTHEGGVLSLLEGIVNVLQKAPEVFTDPKNPLSYLDDAAALGTAAGQGVAAGGGVPGAPAAGGGMTYSPAGVLSKNMFWDRLADGTFGEEEVGRGTKNDGTNSDPDEASKSGIEGEKEHGDGPEQLKDVGGAGGADESMSHEPLQGDPALQDKAMKAFHMNLPLVIEFANSDEPGADNPIMRALDELLEEAFPGYKDGHDQAGAEDEHPVTEIQEEIHPEEKDDSDDSDDEGDDKPEKKEKEASYLSEDDWFHLSYGAPIMPGTGDPVTPGAGAPAAMQPQAPGAGTCPMCGQSHIPGTPCPTTPTNQVQAPAAAGGQITPPQPQTVVTKWQVVSMGEIPAPTPGVDDIGVLAPDGGNDVGVRGPVDDLSPGDVIAAYPDGTIVLDDGITTYNMQRAQEFAAQHGWSRQAAVDPEFAFFAAAGEGEHHHEHEVEHKPEHHEVHNDGGDTSEASTPWLDESGAPLQEGADYELKSSNYAIPDRITIDRILPDRITYTLHSGEVDYTDEMSKEELQTEGFSFAPSNPDHADVDSMDGFDPAENPVRPGQDPTPQVDDLSSSSTVVSSDQFEYMPKFAGDQLQDRSWLFEGKDDGVAVDPGLMAKLAGKNYSPREQREFINESGEARNLDRLDLAGTHYVLDGINTDDALW